MSRRKQIEMSEQQIHDFLTASKTIVLTSNGPSGHPHPMPMWFQMGDDGSIQMTTYARSQKVQNLRRDARVSLLCESGVEYAELRGVVLYGDAEIIDDVDQIIDVLLAASSRDDSTAEQSDQIRAGMRANAAKRVLIHVKPDRKVSWDHTRLGGKY